MATKTSLLSLIAGVGLWLAVIAAPVAAFAGGCCSPPSPPPSCGCTPPPCCSPANNIVVPGVNVFVAPSVVVNVQANAQVVAGAAAQTQAATFVGGGSSFIQAPGPVGLVNLDVQGERRAAYQATRTVFEKVIVQAFCFDDREVPHPASQVSPDRDVDLGYDGELYRCIAGAHMQVTVAKWNETMSFAGGDTLSCNKGEALYHAPGHDGGRLECRPQIPARDCNERSLLRRFGAGMKILIIARTETYTAYREEHESSGASTMSLDGGVGGVVY